MVLIFIKAMLNRDTKVATQFDREESMMKKTVNKNILFYGATAVLIMIITLCCSITVMSKSDITAKEKQAYYLEKEQEVVKETRAFLNEKGFRNSGVSMTRIVNGEGEREYTIMLHHEKFNKLEEGERELLKEELTKFTFADEDCTFCHEFLMAY